MNSIRNRVLIVLALAGLVPLIAMIFVAQTLTRWAIEELQREQMGEFTEEVGRNVERYILNASRDLASLATNQIISKEFKENTRWDEAEKEAAYNSFIEEKRQEVDRIVRTYSDFFDITLYDSRGVYIASTSSPGIANLGYNYFNSIEHTNALDGLPTIASPRIPDSGMTDFSGIPDVEIVFCLPVRKDSKTISVIHASLNFGKIWEALDHARMGRTGKFVLLDERNNVLYHSDKTRVFDLKWSREEK